MWPSLVALVGTVAVVVALLMAFGDRVGDSSDDATADDVGDDTSEVESEPLPDGNELADGNESGDVGENDATPEPEPSVVTADPDVRQPIGVLNGTNVNALAAQAQERFEDGGWEVPAIATYNGAVEATTVYYPDGMEDAAAALMGQFPEIERRAPTIEGLNTTRLVVILGDDYAEALGLAD